MEWSTIPACPSLYAFLTRAITNIEGTRKGDKELVQQHQGLDRDGLPRPPVDGRQQNSLEEVCFFCPQVPPTTAKSRRTK